MAHNESMNTDQLVANAVRKGHNAARAAARLAELLGAHDGDNLAHALSYEGYATERQAYRFIAGMAS